MIAHIIQDCAASIDTGTPFSFFISKSTKQRAAESVVVGACHSAIAVIALNISPPPPLLPLLLPLPLPLKKKTQKDGRVVSHTAP